MHEFRSTLPRRERPSRNSLSASWLNRIPECDRDALPSGAYTCACRKVYRLAYRSQRETPRDRAPSGSTPRRNITAKSIVSPRRLWRATAPPGSPKPHESARRPKRRGERPPNDALISPPHPHQAAHTGAKAMPAGLHGHVDVASLLRMLTGCEIFLAGLRQRQGSWKRLVKSISVGDIYWWMRNPPFVVPTHFVRIDALDGWLRSNNFMAGVQTCRSIDWSGAPPDVRRVNCGHRELVSLTSATLS